MNKLLSGYMFVLTLLVSIPISADPVTQVENRWNGKVLSHQLTPTSRNSFDIGSFPDFIRVALSSTHGEQVRYLPVARISEINHYSTGVYIEWQGVRMKNGNGYMVTTLFIPADLQSPNETLEQIRTAMRNNK